MIDQQGAPLGWIYDGKAHCANHAEARWGAALYREPRLKDASGIELTPLRSPDWFDCECAECIQAREARLELAQQRQEAWFQKQGDKRWDVV